MGLKKLRDIKRRQQNAIRKKFRTHKHKNLMADAGVHPFIIILDNLQPSYNIGKIFRSADAFGAREVHLIGIDFFDPTPAMGSFKWVPAKFHADFRSCFHDLTDRGYTFFTLEPGSSESVHKAAFPEKSAFIFGNEEHGISIDRKKYPQIISLAIPQFGKVESLNVSIAASVVMYEYICRHNAQL